MALSPKKPGVGIMIALGKPSGPPALKSPGSKYADAPPQHQEPDADDYQGGGKVSPEDVDYSSNDLCETCANMGDDGTCTKYGFQVEPTGHCEAGYQPREGAHDQDQGSDFSQDQGGDYGQPQAS